ncbi:MAG: zinc ABC transporter substrate-binding protein [Candidatus Omnitrophica bacterium]|nr:zinc ABC transporter substrate-binding protein [Candidatus Omnitrophota bacterium]
MSIKKYYFNLKSVIAIVIFSVKMSYCFAITGLCHCEPFYWAKQSFRNIGLLGLFFVFFTVTPAHADKIKAVATFSVIADMVRHVAGDSIDLLVLVGPNADAHEYEPVPADSVHISKADIIFENGLHLEHWLDKLYTASGTKAKRIIVSRGVSVRTMGDNPQESDPHAWQDVTNVILYAQNICDALVVLDPVNRVKYEAQTKDYVKQLQALDGWVKAQVALISVEKRKLVTNHDALGYFARRYGFQIIGAVIPSATTEAADPSALQTAQLLDIIKKNNVRAIFSENMANLKLAQTLSKEAGVAVGPELYTDALGVIGSDAQTYIQMIKHNVKIFVEYLK